MLLLRRAHELEQLWEDLGHLVHLRICELSRWLLELGNWLRRRRLALNLQRWVHRRRGGRHAESRREHGVSRRLLVLERDGRHGHWDLSQRWVTGCLRVDGRRFSSSIGTRLIATIVTRLGLASRDGLGIISTITAVVASPAPLVVIVLAIIVAVSFGVLRLDDRNEVVSITRATRVWTRVLVRIIRPLGAHFLLFNLLAPIARLASGLVIASRMTIGLAAFIGTIRSRASALPFVVAVPSVLVNRTKTGKVVPGYVRASIIRATSLSVLTHGDPAASGDALGDTNGGATVGVRAVALPFLCIRHAFHILRTTSNGG